MLEEPGACYVKGGHSAAFHQPGNKSKAGYVCIHEIERRLVYLASRMSECWICGRVFTVMTHHLACSHLESDTIEPLSGSQRPAPAPLPKAIYLPHRPTGVNPLLGSQRPPPAPPHPPEAIYLPHRPTVVNPLLESQRPTPIA
ncbi:hypothetical protein MHYP_G00225120 [Metynnis hypsauchen]